MMMSERNSRNPFTATQWQELHHQALIFNYMSSGMCVPHHLLFPIRRSTDHQPGLLSRLFPHPQMDWGGGRKVDPEPGRCKRTDGKKWRCSKEACADSKYCERHMYRGKSRSRKPVELVTNSTTPPNPKNPSTTKDTPTSSKQGHPYPIHSFLYPHSKSSASSQNNKTLSILDSQYYSHSHQPDPRQVNERAFFSEASGTLLKTSLYKSCSQSGYSHLDLKVEPPQQPLRHFFDERPPKSKGSWLGLGEDISDRSSHSTTQLSISLPFYSHDFFK